MIFNDYYQNIDGMRKENAIHIWDILLLAIFLLFVMSTNL